MKIAVHNRSICMEVNRSVSPVNLHAGYARNPSEEYNDDRFPIWISATILVALSSVFWIGLITIIGWFTPLF